MVASGIEYILEKYQFDLKLSCIIRNHLFALNHRSEEIEVSSESINIY